MKAMKYKYPYKSNYVTIKNIENDKFIAYDNMLCEKHELTYEEAKYLSGLDGKTNPFEPDMFSPFTEDECKKLYESLSEKKLIREGRKLTQELDNGKSEKIYSLFIPKEKENDNAKAFKVLNWLLIILTLGLMVYFVFNAKDLFYSIPKSDNLATVISFFIAILVLWIFAGISHVVACRAYGAKLWEIQIARSKLIYFYADMNENIITGKSKKTQTCLARLESNLVILIILLIVNRATDIYLYSYHVSFATEGLKGFFLGSILAGFLMTLLSVLFDLPKAASELAETESVFKDCITKIKNLFSRDEQTEQTNTGFSRKLLYSILVLICQVFTILCCVFVAWQIFR